MNTRSVAELVISHIINLSRQVNMRNIEMHNKIWNKNRKQRLRKILQEMRLHPIMRNSCKYGRNEVRGSSVFDQFSNNVGVNGLKERLYCQTLF